MTVALSAFALDLGTKAWANVALQEGTRAPFLPGLIHFTLTTNTGGAFGIGKESKELMTLLAVVVCCGIMYYLWRREHSLPPPANIERVGLGLMLGSALGNIVNRLLSGRVTDFIEFSFFSFPVFNVADVLIDVGLGLFLIHAFFSPQPEKAKDV